VVIKSKIMQTILGSGGVIGTEIARALPFYTKQIRLVSRKPKAVNPGDELFPADLTNAEDVLKAVKGSEIVYLTAGLQYNLKVWETTWPVIMKNVIEACRVHGAKLVFFDNIYMYDSAYLNGMNEETPINPPSRKGRVRAQIAAMVTDAVKKGEINALIARSADFYGPGNTNSILTETVFKNFSKGKKANWMGPVNFKHSFTYTPDAGKATALLGNTPDAFGQVWHLPTAPDPFTGKQWIVAIAEAMNVKPAFMPVPGFMVRIMGIFIPIMREFVEMSYQNDRDYVFDSSKFNKRFNLAPTPYTEGIRTIVETDFKKGVVRK
jgi:nucleoside-diphosphate-sugar epimerase